MESSGCESRPAKASQQAGSQCCHSPGDRWVRSVHSKEAGREDSAPKSKIVADADAVMRAEGCTRTAGRVRTYGAAGVSSSGHASKRDSPGTQESFPSPQRRYRPPRETRGDRGWMAEQSYDPIVPVKVGNRRALRGGGHGTHWREGGNIRTPRFGDTWRHAEVEPHVHRTESVI